jgi:hypothetical protein
LHPSQQAQRIQYLAVLAILFQLSKTAALFEMI